MAQNIRVEVLTGCHISAQALAELFGVTAHMIRRYVNDYGMPRDGHGKYLLGECVQWYINRLRLQADGVETSDIAEEKLKLVRAQRHRVELENKKRRGELLDAELVATVLNQSASVYASQLDGMGARMAALLSGISDPGEIQRVLLDECRSIRESAAAVFIDLANADDHVGDPAAPKEKKRGAVGRRKPNTAKRKPRTRAMAN